MLPLSQPTIQPVPFQTKLKKLTKEGILGSYHIVEKDGLHNANALRIFWENFKGVVGFKNKADAALIKKSASNLISDN
jgi:hypothetical protein